MLFLSRNFPCSLAIKSTLVYNSKDQNLYPCHLLFAIKLINNQQNRPSSSRIYFLYWLKNMLTLPLLDLNILSVVWFDLDYTINKHQSQFSWISPQEFTLRGSIFRLALTSLLRSIFGMTPLWLTADMFTGVMTQQT